jgi:hypothetical protein
MFEGFQCLTPTLCHGLLELLGGLAQEIRIFLPHVETSFVDCMDDASISA